MNAMDEVVDAGDMAVYVLAAEKANEFLPLIADFSVSKYQKVAQFGLILAKEEMYGYKRTTDDQELSDRINSWIDPKLKFKGEP
jgi:hypothetical protein